MADSDERTLREARYRSRNPYAGVEYIDPEMDGLAPFFEGNRPEAPPARSHASGTQPVVPSYGTSPTTNAADQILSQNVKKQSGYSESDIEAVVRQLLREIWVKKERLWPKGVPQNPVDLLDPGVVLEGMNYEFKVKDGLGQYRPNGAATEVAGILDDARKEVSISAQFPMSYRRFTSAHELGHALLHNIAGTVHRDNPLDGTQRTNDPREWEANKFATFFLMPRKLVKRRFEEIFGPAPFVLNEETAFALTRQNLHSLLRKYPTKRKLCRLLAQTEQYNGEYFTSLADQFGVSGEAMAIRLEELQLVG